MISKKRLGFMMLGVFLGAMLSLFLTEFVGDSSNAWAKKPSQLDIIYKVVAQNYYQTQKSIAYNQFSAALIKAIAEKNKVSTEKIVPHTNRLQQELFHLDLKLKELNK